MSDNCKVVGSLDCVCILSNIYYCLKDREWKNPGHLPGVTLSSCLKAKQTDAESEHGAKQRFSLHQEILKTTGTLFVH